VLARRITDGRQGFDRDGALAAAGTVDEDLLADLLTEPFYSRPAPKSTGKELFHADYLDAFLTPHPHPRRHHPTPTVTAPTAPRPAGEAMPAALLPDPSSPRPAPQPPGKELVHADCLDSFLPAPPHLGDHDAIATVTALTARTIAEACHRYGVTTVIASGGGTRNPELMRRLGQELGDAVEMKGTQEAFGLPEGSKEALLMGLIGWLSWHGLDGTEPSLTGAAGPRIAGRFSSGDGPLQLPEPLHRRPSRLR